MSSGQLDTSALSGASDEDFLDWLSTDNTAGSSGGATPAGAALPASGVADISIDDFFDNILGAPSVAEPPTTTVGGKLGAGERGVEKERQRENKRAPPQPSDAHMSVEERVKLIEKIVSSSLANVDSLRKQLRHLGYIPTELRGHAWSLLVAGNCVEDFEAKHFRVSPGDIDSVTEATMKEDIDAVVGRCHAQGVNVDQEQCREDMHDLLVLYCVRHDTEYHSIMCHILAPLVVCPDPVPRAIAYSAFYSLCKDFVPIINLSSNYLSEALGLVSHLVRLLLCYHFPQLALHLDRLLPGWEGFTTSMVTQQAEAEAKTSEASLGLDELERSMGLGLDSIEHEAEQVAAERRSSAGGIGGSMVKEVPTSSGNARSDGSSAGLIPVHWVCGIFSSSVPVKEAALLWDWATTSGLRYAGVYLLVALLGIYSDALTQQPAGDIRLWFEAVSAGRKEWYSLLQADAAREQPDGWTSFVRGWINAARAVHEQTPGSFHSRLDGTEGEVVEVLKKRKAAAAATMGSPTSTVTPPMSSSMPPGLVSQSTNSEMSIFNRFRHMSNVVGAQLTKTIMPEQSKARPEAGFEMVPDVEAMTSDVVDSLARSIPAVCLQTEPSEVVPSICFPSHGMRGTVENSVVGEFWAGLQAPVLCFRDTDSLSSGRGNNPIVYFGVDCRPESERALGRFPKAYLMDPDSMEDGESITMLLQTLRPLAGNVHICIIGSGQRYFQTRAHQKHRQDKPALSTLRGQVVLDEEETAALNAAIACEESRLYAAAVFFVKRGFAHVSIFSGGFIEAANYLHRSSSVSHSTPPLHSVLVDLDEDGIREFVGLPPMAGQSPLSMPSKERIVEKMQEGNRRVSSMFSTLGASLSEAASKARSSMGGRTEELMSPSSSEPDQTSSNNRGNTNHKFPGNGGGGSMAPAAVVLSVSASPSRSIPHFIQMDTAGDSGGDVTASLGSFTIDGGDDDDEDNDDEKDGTYGGEGGKRGNGDQRAHGQVDDSEQRTRKENLQREMALEQHKISGLRQGDVFVVADVKLFGARFYHVEHMPTEMPPSQGEGDTDGGRDMSVQHRHVLITDDRFIVLDSKGPYLGDEAIVMQNAHLTSVKKVTFRKSQPDRISLVFLSEAPVHLRMSAREEFVRTLQTNMMKFK